MTLVPLGSMWDPNTWTFGEDHEYWIYGDDRAISHAVVDQVDYEWAIRHRWWPSVKKSRGNPLKTKTYLRRNVGVREGGVRVRTISLYLHVEIMKATGVVPPSPAHILVDHRDGNTFNCRRTNLRWATHSMNSRNLYGKEPYDLEELMSCPVLP